MPETKADSHSQGLGFCGKVRAGQGLGGSGMRGSTSSARQRHSCQGGGRLHKDESSLVKGKEDGGTKAGLGQLRIGSDGQTLHALAEWHRFIPQQHCIERLLL